MKKFSSKIIIGFLLALLLWGGVGVETKTSIVSVGFNVAILFAEEDCNEYAAGGAKLVEDCEQRNAEEVANQKETWTTRFLKAAGDAITGVLGKTVMMVQGILLQIILIPLLSVLLRVAAAMFGIATEFTLSTQIFTDTESGVFLVWSFMRNICNITFIFILLWASIQTIIGIASGKTKKIIADVVIAALLINFSLFITRTIIDVGNMLAITLYNKIVSGAGSIDGKIMDALGMSSLWGAMGTAADGAGSVFSVAFGVISYLQVITILVAFITFMYAMLLMAARIVMLIFLAATSPIGFMGNVLPKFSEYSKMWRENLYGQVMVAPIFLLFVYLIVEIGGQFSKIKEVISESGGVSATSSSALSTSISDNPTDYGVYFNYVMIILLLVVAVKITKKMSGVVGSVVEKLGTFAAGAAVGVATGGLALAGRASIGRLGGKIASNEGLADAAKKGGFGGMAARMALKTADKTSKASFDARNTSSFKAATGFIGDQTGLKVDYNKGMSIQKDGYQGAMKRQSEKSEATAKIIDKADVNVTVKEVEDRKQEEANTLATKKAAIIAKQTALGEINNDQKEAEWARLQKEQEELEKSPVKTDEELRKEIEKKKKADRLFDYAKSEENSKLNKLFRNKRETKEAAKKIREAGNDKDAKKLMQDAIKKYEEEETAKKSGGSSSPSSESTTPPPTTP